MTASPTLPFVEIFWRDLRYGMRRLKTSRALTIAAVLTLALGIGANTAIFTIVEAVLLRPLPYSHPQRLVVVWQTDAAHRDSGAFFNSYQEFLAFQQQSRSFEKLAALTWTTGPRSTLWKGKPVDVLALPASVDFFSMLGATAAIGRTFAPSDLPSACTVVLAHHFWQQKLGSPADVVGQTIGLDKSSCQVIGVMSKRFSFYPVATDVWTLITPAGELAQKPWQNMVGAFGLLKPGVSRAAAEAELTAIQVQTVKDAPPDLKMMQNWKPDVLDLQSNFTWLAGRNLRKGLWLLLCASGLLLLMSSVNVGGLLLGRAMEHARDVAVRSALGSTQLRLLVQSFIDALLLGLAGTVAGIALAAALLQWFRSANPVELPPSATISLDSRVLLFAVFAGTVSSVLFAVVPTWHNSRLNLNEMLKSGSRGQSQTRASARATNLLVILQSAMSMLLLVGAVSLSISLLKLTSTNLGYRTDHLFTANINLPQSRYLDSNARSRFASQFESSLASLPGVASASLASDFVPRGLDILAVQGKPDAENPAPDVATQDVSASAFNTLQVPVLQGRVFGSEDRQDTQPVALINQALAREYFPDTNPLGHALKLSRSNDPAQPWLTIVGVVADVKTTTVFQEMGYVENPAVYRPLAQSAPARLALILSTTGRSSALVSDVQQKLSTIDPTLVLGDVDALREMRDAELSQPRFRAALFSGFAVIALVLALVGLYGSLSQMIVRRAHDVSIRMALGADRKTIFRSIVLQACAMTMQGVVPGAIFAAIALRFAHSIFYGISAGGASECAGAAAVLFLLTFAVALAPAICAASIDPIQALRNE